MKTIDMTLIADSGSTKTHWALAGSGSVLAQTQGINPVHQSREQMADILVKELLPHVPHPSAINRIQFYGAGCTAANTAIVESLLTELFPAARVEVGTDLLGAARALFADRPGIACILGTGANSGLYNGRLMVANTPPLGYILGDEGSGANLGIRFLNALYKGRLPRHVAEDFERETQLTYADIIGRVYREPMANRFLASLTPFIHSQLYVPEVSRLVEEAFSDFFRRNLSPYGRRDLPVGFVGSIAFHFSQQLSRVAQREGYTMGEIVKAPIEKLKR